MQLHLNEVADFVATNNLSFSEGLLKLTNYEADYKAENAARSMIKAGAFPHHKELKDFDFSFQPGICDPGIFHQAATSRTDSSSNSCAVSSTLRGERNSTSLALMRKPG